MHSNEIKYHGLYACLALWQQRREAIIRVYLTHARLKECSDLLQWCAAQKKAYHIVDEPALGKISGSVHHEGLCILAHANPVGNEKTLLAALRDFPAHQSSCLIYLDGVQNPHNIGAIMRIAAHFGVTSILGKTGQLPSLSGAALRIAEGGAEFVQLISIHEPIGFFKLLQKQGFHIASTSSHAGTTLYQMVLPKRILFVLGAEVHGVSASLAQAATLNLAIPGTKQVESLNVAMATALLLGEHWRQHSRMSPQPNPPNAVQQI